MTPFLSIVIASRNETAMLCMTVISAIEAIKESGVTGEVVVVENSDEDVHQAAMSCLAGQIKEGNVKVIREARPSICLAIHRAHQEARGEFLFYTDAHTIIGSGTISALLKFFADSKSDKIGFVHSPIQWAHRSSATKRSHLCVNRNKLGEWAGSACVDHPKRVTWKGMPYMIRRSVWDKIGGLGCCAERGLGWGVLPYLGIKTWMLGFENWAIPEGVVYHFGEWPEDVKPYAQYRTYKSGGDHPGLARAVALYVFGGEEAIRDEYQNSRLERFFTSVEQAIEMAVTVGCNERRWLLENQSQSWNDLFANPPWGPDEIKTISMEYRMLNSELHQSTDVKYGYKGWEQAGDVVAAIGRFGCADILDYGAGKQTLSGELSKLGIYVSDYDPAIQAISSPPIPADMVVCCDVLEHIEPQFLQGVINHLRTLCRKVLFLRVCTVPCKSKTLPDGSDPHKIVRPLAWWIDSIGKAFSVVDVTELNDKYFTALCVPS